MSYRNVTPLMHKFRNFLLQRQYVLNNRYPGEQVGRDVPTPNLPDGVTHKLAANYYYTRDGRREAQTVVVVAGSSMKALPEGTDESSETPSAAVTEVQPGMAVPGWGINEDTGKPNGPSPFY